MLLKEFSKVLEVPKELPPQRSCDIPLIDANQTINSRPYHYPFHQKNEIEK